MSNPLKNVTMTNPIKGLVSKRRVRYTDNGFNLDLTYITDNIIAMGFPAENLEGVYRNHIDDVIKLFESRHKHHYYIYNLCSERSYDIKKFHNRVSTYSFDDHHPPPIALIKPFCDDVHKWLSDDANNVAAIHCKAGKGRTGVMICCYLLHSKQYETAAEALNYYGSQRTTDNKGVTIPSQRRYVNYYATLVKENFGYEPVKLILREIKLDPPPISNGGQGCYRFVISEGKNKIFTSEQYEINKGTSSIRITLSESLAITGDIRVDFYSLPKVKRKDKLFHFWFNTYFVRDYLECDNNGGPIERTTRALSCDGSAMEFQSIIPTKPRTGSLANINPAGQTLVLTINKWELDGAHKDKNNKIFASDFKISLLMHRADNPIIQTSPTVPATAAVQPGRKEERIQVGVAHGQEFNDESSESGDTTGGDSTADEDGWESVDLDRGRVGRYRLLSDGGMIDVL